MENVTQLLRAWGGGDSAAGDQVFAAIYHQLRDLARHHSAHSQGNTVQATALVNEAFLRMAGDAKTDWRDRAQFFAFAAIVMRRVMIDYARFRRAGKRDRAAEVCFDEALHDLSSNGLDIERLDEALTRLSTIDSRQAKIVELRFFGGMTVEETATYLDISPRTVNREWGMAKVWLASALSD